MPRPQAVCRRAAVTRASRSEARLQPVTARRDSWRSHVHRTLCHIRKAAKLPTAVQSAGCAALRAADCQCAGSRGKAPRPFSRGLQRGDTLFREREYPPFTHSRTVRESSSCTDAGKYFYASGVRTPFSVTSIVQRISCSSTGTSGDMSCSRQMSTVGQWSCGSRRS